MLYLYKEVVKEANIANHKAYFHHLKFNVLFGHKLKNRKAQNIINKPIKLFLVTSYHNIISIINKRGIVALLIIV
jgi:hypothetical protein